MKQEDVVKVKRVKVPLVVGTYGRQGQGVGGSLSRLALVPASRLSADIRAFSHLLSSLPKGFILLTCAKRVSELISNPETSAALCPCFILFFVFPFDFCFSSPLNASISSPVSVRAAVEDRHALI